MRLCLFHQDAGDVTLLLTAVIALPALHRTTQLLPGLPAEPGVFHAESGKRTKQSVFQAASLFYGL